MGDDRQYPRALESQGSAGYGSDETKREKAAKNSLSPSGASHRELFDYFGRDGLAKVQRSKAESMVGIGLGRAVILSFRGERQPCGSVSTELLPVTRKDAKNRLAQLKSHKVKLKRTAISLCNPLFSRKIGSR